MLIRMFKLSTVWNFVVVGYTTTRKRLETTAVTQAYGEPLKEDHSASKAPN